MRLCEQAGYPTDLGGYYIRHLVQDGYLEKMNRGQYTITPQGKRYLALGIGPTQRFLPRPNVMLVAKQLDTYAFLERATQPFIGRIEWPAGVIRNGENMATAAARITESRLQVTGQQSKLLGFFRRTDMYKDNIFDDKIFAVHIMSLPADVPLAQKAGEHGKVLLATAKEMETFERASRSLLDIFRYVQAGGGLLQEHVYHLTHADLTIEE